MGNSISQFFGGKTNREEVQEGYASRQAVNVSPRDLRVATSESEWHSWVFVRKRIVSNYDSRLNEFEFEDDASDKDLHELFCPLTNKEEGEVSRVLHGRKGREILVVHEPSNIVISTEEIKCLSWNGWLNDEVINLYLELLKEREKREPKRFLKCHFFNTFFYKKLTSGRTGYDFKAVRRWTSHRKLGYYLSDCEKIFFPIHKDVHWCLAVVDVKKKTFLYLDSLGGMGTHVLSILAQYLTDEVKDKSGQEIDIISWKQESVDNLPQQKNGWDCGMFMLKYCDFYSRGLSLCFGQEHMEYFRKRTVKEILNLTAE